MNKKTLNIIASYISLSIKESIESTILITLEDVVFHCNINESEIEKYQETICKIASKKSGYKVSYDSDCKDFEIYR